MASASASSLSILAGPKALAELREHGLSPARVRVFVGASGGPKWLVLYGLDRVLFPDGHVRSPPRASTDARAPDALCLCNRLD